MIADEAAVLQELDQVLRKVFGATVPKASRSLTALDVDGWDSLRHAQFMLAVERHFEIRLPGERLFELADIGELVDLILPRLGSKASQPPP